MMSVKIKIRRFDSSESNPQIIEKSVMMDTQSEYNTLKKELQDICQVGPEDNKVIKLRREDEVLVPLSFLLETHHDAERYFYIDVCKINYTNKATATLLQDAYIDSVCQKLRNMESRVVKAEMLLPQLEWRREAHMEDTVNTLSNKVSFLDRRLDQLMPEEWRSQMPQTIA